MCEELSAAEALNSLQIGVSLVVDHGDVDEAESFRSLLSYFLARKPSRTSHSRAPSSWTLVDSDESQQGVPPYLAPHSTKLFVIYAMSPCKERWSRPDKTVCSIVVVMNPWT